jgi:hypothetical protein
VPHAGPSASPEDELRIEAANVITSLAHGEFHPGFVYVTVPSAHIDARDCGWGMGLWISVDVTSPFTQSAA